jgi:hypothetical protein
MSSSPHLTAAIAQSCFVWRVWLPGEGGVLGFLVLVSVTSRHWYSTGKQPGSDTQKGVSRVGGTIWAWRCATNG